MKVSVLVVFIVLPMLISIGLYTYAFISTRWSYLDENFIIEHTSVQAKTYSPLESRMIRHGFRSFYGLFGYCMDYKWLHLLTMKSSNSIDEQSKPMNSSSNCPYCDSSSASICPQTGCCMNTCDMMPDCPSYIDEKSCNRTYNQTRYYWPEANCIWYSTWITFEDLSLDLSSWMPTTMKRLRYLTMFSLFIAAPLFTVLALLILLCINCVERFYSIPFAFVSFFSFASFLSGSGALGLFLYEWIHERFYHQSTDAEAILLALNPWIIHAERFGLAFWILVAAIATNLFTAMLSCCFCCGLQSDKSKLRIHVKNDKYEIVHMSAYDD